MHSVRLLLGNTVKGIVVVGVHAVAVNVDVLVPRRNWARLELVYGFGKWKWLSGVDPCLVESEVSWVNNLCSSGEHHLSVSWKVVGFGYDCVEVVDDFGSGCCGQPVNREAYVVYASFGGFARSIGNSNESVPFSCTRRKRGREENFGISQKVEEI